MSDVHSKDHEGLRHLLRAEQLAFRWEQARLINTKSAAMVRQEAVKATQS
jgi:hypothetical protein